MALECVHLGRKAEQVDGNDGTGRGVIALATASGSTLKVPGSDIHENRCGPAMDHDVGGRDPGEGGDDHLVAWADARGDQREMQRRRAGRHREGVLDLMPCRESLLEVS